MKKISVLVPCYNEVGNVQAMADILTEIMKKLPYEYEIIFTDNCSFDGTKDVLREIAGRDNHIKVLMNNRNYGTDGRSGRNTLKYVSGDVIVGIACDFQEPPELIPEFIKYWEQGYKVVCGQKIGSKEGRVKYQCRCFYYKLLRTLSETEIYPNISGITLYDREVLKEFIKSDENLNFRFALGDMGYKAKFIPYEQQARKSGKSSYNVWRYLNYAITSMTMTSTSPLRLMTIMGVIMSFLSFLIGLIYLILKLVFWFQFQAGTSPILIGMFFLGSVQLFFMGILGEYIGAILRKVSKYPDVIVSEKINFEGFNEHE